MQEFELGNSQQEKASYLGLDEFLGSNIGILAFPSSSPHSIWEDPLTTFAHTKSISVEADEVAVPKKGTFRDSSRLLSSTEAPKPQSIVLQDFVFLSDFISVPELVNAL